MANTSIAIRPFRDENAPALWQVFHSAIHGIASRDYSPKQIAVWAPPQWDTEQWAKRMRGIQPFVAERGGVIVGYADVQENGYIDHFFVAANAARQGVGSRLMERIHGTAATRNLPLLFSHVSITARPFFERWGFAVEREQKLELGSVALTNYLMRKQL